LTSRNLAKKIAGFAFSKKASDVQLLDLRKVSDVADFFVLCSADSDVQVKAIADSILDGLAESDVHPWHREGVSQKQWILLDFIDVVVHVFHRDARKFYGLEKLWGDAKIEALDDAVAAPAHAPAQARRAGAAEPGTAAKAAAEAGTKAPGRRAPAVSKAPAAPGAGSKTPAASKAAAASKAPAASRAAAASKTPAAPKSPGASKAPAASKAASASKRATAGKSAAGGKTAPAGKSRAARKPPKK